MDDTEASSSQYATGRCVRSVSRRTSGAAVKPLVCTRVERTRVQILVVVANTPVRALKTEVEQVFVRTALGHESVDPKPWGKPLVSQPALGWWVGCHSPAHRKPPGMAKGKSVQHSDTSVKGSEAATHQTIAAT